MYHRYDAAIAIAIDTRIQLETNQNELQVNQISEPQTPETQIYRYQTFYL